MAVNNSLQQTKNNKPQTFSAFLTSDAIKKRVNSMVGGNDGQRFITSIISAVSTNPALAGCEHSTILSAAMLGESLKLSPSPQLGQYYMVPFKQKAKYDRTGQLISQEKTVAQFQLGYKGYIQLAIRSGYYKKLNVLAIKEGELKRYDPLNEEIEVQLIEDEMEREAAQTIGYFAMFEYNNGFRKTMYWSRQKMMAHADKYSQAFSVSAQQIKGKKGKIYNKVSFADYEAGNYPQDEEWLYSSFWYKDFDGMAYKTMLRQLISKWGIMSIEMQKAMDGAMGAINEDGSVEYVDNDDAAPQEVNRDNVIEVDPETGAVVSAPAYDDDPAASFFDGSDS